MVFELLTPSPSAKFCAVALNQHSPSEQTKARKMDPFEGKTVFITGGTGSFGTAFTKELLRRAVRKVIIFSRDEAKQDDMLRHFADSRISFRIGDVRDYNSLAESIDQADIILHAAGLKQVPSCELNPSEAIRTNVLGAENVLRAARNCRVGRVVCISTDKAVLPINAMGLSKALMEKCVSAYHASFVSDAPVCTAVRYGNVMASRGSVIPLFVEQIKAGKPLTITDPDMTRFLMPMADAVSMVEFALGEGQASDILVKKTESCRIGQLAQVLCDIFRVKCQVNIIGPRLGEKKHECLLTRDELIRAEDLGPYFRIPAPTADRSNSMHIAHRIGQITADYTSDILPQLTDLELKEKLLRLDYIQTESEAFRQ